MPESPRPRTGPVVRHTDDVIALPTGTQPVQIVSGQQQVSQRQQAAPVWIQTPPDTAHADLAEDIVRIRDDAHARLTDTEAQIEALRTDWEDHQRRLNDLHRQATVVAGEMDDLAKQLDPLLTHQTKLAATVQHFDTVLEGFQ